MIWQSNEEVRQLIGWTVWEILDLMASLEDALCSESSSLRRSLTTEQYAEFLRFSSTVSQACGKLACGIDLNHARFGLPEVLLTRYSIALKTDSEPTT